MTLESNKTKNYRVIAFNDSIDAGLFENKHFSTDHSWLMYFTFDPGLNVTVNLIFDSEGARCLYAPWFIFGLPRHFHLLLCDYLVFYRYLYFAVK